MRTEFRHVEHSTSIIKKLFEDKDVGKVGLQYLVAWSIYRQLAKFTDPYLMRNYRKADEACFLLVKDVMRMAIISNYFWQLIPYSKVTKDATRVGYSIKSAFEKAVGSSSWLSDSVREFFSSKVADIHFKIGSPGHQIIPWFMEKVYGQYCHVYWTPFRTFKPKE
ncbi:hypothetical protein MTO96_031373 [Rhipicephalus appendiculatus]